MTALNKQALREAAERAIHDDWGYGTDIFHEQVTPSVVLALLDECAALAAENTGLKAAKEIIRHLNVNREEANFCGIDDCYIDDAVAAMITPATDAFLAEVRARALDEFAKVQDEQAKKYYELSPGCSGQNECQFAAGQAWYYAECIRKGAAQ